MTQPLNHVWWVRCRDDDEDAAAVIAPTPEAAIQGSHALALVSGSVNTDIRQFSAEPYFDRFPEVSRDYVPQIEIDASGNVLRAPWHA